MHHIASWVGAHHIGERVKKGGNGQLGMERVERVSVKMKKKKLVLKKRVVWLRVLLFCESLSLFVGGCRPDYHHVGRLL